VGCGTAETAGTVLSMPPRFLVSAHTRRFILPRCSLSWLSSRLCVAPLLMCSSYSCLKRPILPAQSGARALGVALEPGVGLAPGVGLEPGVGCQGWS
jgi:hypothetical protein